MIAVSEACHAAQQAPNLMQEQGQVIDINAWQGQNLPEDNGVNNAAALAVVHHEAEHHPAPAVDAEKLLFNNLADIRRLP